MLFILENYSYDYIVLIKLFSKVILNINTFNLLRIDESFLLRSILSEYFRDNFNNYINCYFYSLLFNFLY